jgi:hypothetical protein
VRSWLAGGAPCQACADPPARGLETLSAQSRTDRHPLRKGGGRTHPPPLTPWAPASIVDRKRPGQDRTSCAERGARGARQRPPWGLSLSTRAGGKGV